MDSIMNVVCGRSCSVEVGTATYSAHSATLQQAGNLTDVTGFGSGIYGQVVVCTVSGTLTVQCYEYPQVSLGDVVTWTMVVAETDAITLSGSGIVQDIGTTPDGKGVVQNTLTIHVTGTIEVSIAS